MNHHKKYMVWVNYGSYEGWTMAECETWDEAAEKWHEMSGYGHEAVITEYIPIRITDARSAEGAEGPYHR